MEVTTRLIEAHIFRMLNNDLEFLLIKRSEKETYPGIWQMVTGAIEENEKGYEAAVREIKEETGLTPGKLWVVPKINSFYYPELDKIFMIPVFAAEVNGTEEIILSEEHTEFKWVNKSEAQKLLAWPGQREAVEIIHEYVLNESSFLKFVEINISKT